MTEKQKRFVDEYLIDLNATRAYKAAYPSVKIDQTAAVNASKLLRNTKVQEYLQQRRQARQDRTAISQDRVVGELAAIGFTDLRSDENYLWAKDDQGNKLQGQPIYRAADKIKALELLGKHIGIFSEKVEVSGSLKSEMTKLDDLVKQMQGDDDG